MRVLVTGANGFVGRALCRDFWGKGREVVATVRRSGTAPGGCEERIVADIGPDTDWAGVLDGVDAVAHLAARVHVMCDEAADPLAGFGRVNVSGTHGLARTVAQAGVRRFVFVSSIKVNGEGTLDDPFSEIDPPEPVEAYVISKWEAEKGLLEIATERPLEVVILRPLLLYGPGVKGNFLSLMRLCDKGVPLPLGGITNERSLLYLGNLIDAVNLCLSHPAVAGKAYLLRDGEDLSTSDLIRRLAAALGRRPPLFPVPGPLFRFAGWCFGRRAEVERLLGSLAVDNGPIRRDSGWTPPFTVEEGLAHTAAWYMAKNP